MEEEIVVVVDQEEQEVAAPCISYKSLAVSTPRLVFVGAMALLGTGVAMLLIIFPTPPTAVRNWLILVAIILLSPVLMIFYQLYVMVLPRFYTSTSQSADPQPTEP
jgi:hypothetical protein